MSNEVSETIDISDLKPEDVLAELYNRAQPLGFGFLVSDPNPMTSEQATEILDADWVRAQRLQRGGTVHFDYIKGRPIKVSLVDDGKGLRGAWLYDRDQGGPGSCQAAIDAVRARSSDSAAAQ